MIRYPRRKIQDSISETQASRLIIQYSRLKLQASQFNTQDSKSNGKKPKPNLIALLTFAFRLLPFDFAWPIHLGLLPIGFCFLPSDFAACRGLTARCLVTAFCRLASAFRLGPLPPVGDWLPAAYR
jgi:hypothetical protein